MKITEESILCRVTLDRKEIKFGSKDFVQSFIWEKGHESWKVVLKENWRKKEDRGKGVREQEDRE